MSWDFVRVYNVVEAVFWCGLGGYTACQVASIRASRRGTAIILAATLVIFGASDVVEVFSGAWWRPWWLAVWKVLCGFTISLCIWRMGGARRFRTVIRPPLDSRGGTAESLHRKESGGLPAFGSRVGGGGVGKSTASVRSAWPFCS